MGLFGFGKKKEPVPPVEQFLYQRLDAAGPYRIYSFVRRDMDTVGMNSRYSPGSTVTSPIMILGGEYDVRTLGKRLGVDEAGMDPIPQKQSSYYYSLFRYKLLDYAAEKGSANAAAHNFFVDMANSNEDSVHKAEDLLKFGTGELGQKYMEILDALKKNMVGTNADATQQESYVVTACHVLRETDLSQLNEYHRSVYERAHEILTAYEFEDLAFSAGYALFCMSGLPVNHPSAICRLAKVLSTRDKSYFKETYGMELSVSEDMLTIANRLLEPVVLKAREGDSNCIIACRLWGVG